MFIILFLALKPIFLVNSFMFEMSNFINLLNIKNTIKNIIAVTKFMLNNIEKIDIPKIIMMNLSIGMP